MRDEGSGTRDQGFAFYLLSFIPHPALIARLPTLSSIATRSDPGSIRIPSTRTSRSHKFRTNSPVHTSRHRDAERLGSLVRRGRLYAGEPSARAACRADEDRGGTPGRVRPRPRDEIRPFSFQAP